MCYYLFDKAKHFTKPTLFNNYECLNQASLPAGKKRSRIFQIGIYTLVRSKGSFLSQIDVALIWQTAIVDLAM